MARKRSRSTAQSQSPRLVRHVVRVLFTISVAAALVAGVVWFGTRAGEQVAADPRFATRFADIDCPAPPGRSREAFLSEVRYLGNAPETIQSVDPSLGERLAAIFRRHPWVESVDGVDVTADRAVRVRLTFRVPVLLVRVAGGTPAERLVNASGVLLPPVSQTPAGVAVLVNEVPPPPVDAGRVWDDPVVTRAASLAREFQAVRVEKTEKGWRVTQASGRVLSVSW
jgi:hypothetical protein